MAALLAGGIYQTRELIDRQYEEMDERINSQREKISKMEKIEKVLKKFIGIEKYELLMEEV